MLNQCWADVEDSGPALVQHWVYEYVRNKKMRGRNTYYNDNSETCVYKAAAKYRTKFNYRPHLGQHIRRSPNI